MHVLPTVYVDQTSPVADETFRGPEQVIETDAEANLLDDLAQMSRSVTLYIVSTRSSSAPCSHILH